MADPLSIASVALQGVSILGGLFGASDAEKKAREQAAKEAAIERQITDERIRQIQTEERVLRGQTIANTAASGIKTTSGSPMEVLAEQEYEFMRERLITEQVGASKVTAALDRGSALASQYRTQAYSSVGQGVQSIFSILSENKRSTGSYWGE